MEHERYNLVEGFYFINMTMQMLMAGSTFCRDAAPATTRARISAELEEAMAYHRSSKAFEDLLHGLEEQICTDPDPDTYDRIFKDTQAGLDRNVLDPNKKCDYLVGGEGGAPDSVAVPSYLTSNPPNPADAILILEGNMRMTMVAAYASVQLNAEMCVQSDTEEAPPDGFVDELIERMLASVDIPNLKGTGSAALNDFTSLRLLALPTVYHKLILACLPLGKLGNAKPCLTLANANDAKGDDPYVFDLAGGSDGDPSPVFDLTTSLSCEGAACASAASAVFDYQKMLGAVTKMRWDTVATANGKAPVDPYLEQTVWIKQSNCQAFANMVDSAIFLAEELPKVVAALTANIANLEVSCVAPPRDVSPEAGFVEWDSLDPNGHTVHATDNCVDKRGQILT